MRTRLLVSMFVAAEVISRFSRVAVAVQDRVVAAFLGVAAGARGRFVYAGCHRTPPGRLSTMDEVALRVKIRLAEHDALQAAGRTVYRDAPPPAPPMYPATGYRRSEIGLTLHRLPTQARAERYHLVRAA